MSTPAVIILLELSLTLHEFMFVLSVALEEVVVKKSWKGRIPMMKSLRKHSEDVILPVQLEPAVDGDSIRQFGVPLEDCFPSPHNEV